MNYRIQGPFQVTLTPQSSDAEFVDDALGRLLIDKRFEGDLTAASKGQMLSAGTGYEGSGAYVAIEKVSGTLRGRKGSFILQHNASMTRGKPELSIVVVPDSGTDQLEGLSGTMDIIIRDGGAHFYDFDYSVPE